MIKPRTPDDRWNARTLATNSLPRTLMLARGIIALVVLAVSWDSAAQTAPPTDTLSCANLALAEQAIGDANPSAAKRLDSTAQSAADRASCWIDLAALPASAATQPTWIDVRAAADVRAAPIPGALVIPLVELSTKAFLQNTLIVLIGSGRDDADLVRACGELKRAGFQQAKLLRGGIRAWVNAQRPVLVAAGVVQTFDLITPSEFHRQAAGAPWLVLGVDAGTSEGLAIGAISFEQITAGVDAVRALDAIRRRQAAIARMSANERPNAIVIVTRDGASATRLLDAERNAGLTDVLVLQGGMAGYLAFLVQQQDIAAAAGKPLVRACGSG